MREDSVLKVIFRYCEWSEAIKKWLITTGLTSLISASVALSFLLAMTTGWDF
ncbi:MAG: hypothetical protein LBJ17_01935 [Dysgonamonadaceae bacterium]|jgi:hypothetical protein|nr:hypothetical protein [Dysgonamonadaceae bacterium]